MKYLKEIKIQNINLDKRPFSFSFPEFDQKLSDSISSIGLVNPPTLLSTKKENKYFIISGLRRILSCKKLGIKVLTCSIIKARQVAATGWSYRSSEKKLCQKNTMLQDCNTEMELNYEKFILLNLEIKLSHRDLNDIEKANLFKLLGGSGISQGKIIRKYMPYLKLEKSRKIYEDIMSLYSLDIRSKVRTLEWNLPLKISAALARYPKSDRVAVIKIAEILMPGINRLKEITMFLEEIALIKKCSISDITKQHIVNIVKNSKICRKERTEMVRQKLKGLRYPELAKMGRKWDKCVKELHLPREIKIIPPLSFEGKKIKLEISLSNKGAVSRSLLKLNEALRSSSLVQLIDLVNTK